MDTTPEMKIALTIAGSDSGGGAGIQADLKTFHQFGIFGTSVVTAVTAQNTCGVSDIHVVPVESVRRQLTAVAEDLRPDATKSGMLATVDLVRAAAESIGKFRFQNYVLDPVMVATSGDRLLDAAAEGAVAELLIPLATVVTPNRGEAEVLLGREIRDAQDMEEAGQALLSMGAAAALVKGGHWPGDDIMDVLVQRTGVRRFTHSRIATASTHGTGCTLSAAIAAGLAIGRRLEAAVEDALDFVHRAIAAAPRMGSGAGPLNHFVQVPEAGDAA